MDAGGDAVRPVLARADGVRVVGTTLRLTANRRILVGRCRVLRLDARLQRLERLGAHLADAALGHAEEASELLRGPLLQEVADDHEALAFGQQRDRVTQIGVQLAPETRLLVLAHLLQVGGEIGELRGALVYQPVESPWQAR